MKPKFHLCMPRMIPFKWEFIDFNASVTECNGVSHYWRVWVSEAALWSLQGSACFPHLPFHPSQPPYFPDRATSSPSTHIHPFVTDEGFITVYQRVKGAGKKWMLDASIDGPRHGWLVPPETWVGTVSWWQHRWWQGGERWLRAEAGGDSSQSGGPGDHVPALVPPYQSPVAPEDPEQKYHFQMTHTDHM